MSEFSDELTDNAVGTIISMVEQHPGKITILALGPLTNIARVLNKRPDLAANIKQIVMMGGAIRVPGNKNRVAEFNFFVDPEAVDVVFKSDVKKVLVPLDACNLVRLYMDDFEKLQDTYFYDEISQMMTQYISRMKKFESVNGAVVYDALAAYYLLAPDACVLEEMDIVIETKGEHTFGMSVADTRKYSEKHNNTTVVTRIDESRFRDDFIRIFSSATTAE